MGPLRTAFPLLISLNLVVLFSIIRCGIMDKRRTSQNPDKFRDLLMSAAEGLALFHPSLDVEYGGAVGDCGYMESGRFWKLFNVFEDPPPGIPGLPPPQRGCRRTETLPNNGVLTSSNSSAFSLRGGLPFSSPPFEIDASLNVSQNETSVAFLAYGGQNHEVDEWRETKVMKDYLLANEDLIIKAFDTTPVAACGLLLLFGTTRVNAWCGGVAHAYGSSVQASIKVTLAGIDVVEAAATSTASNQGVSTHADWAITRGPLDPAYSDSPPKYCVIVRPVIIRRRERLWRRATTMLEARSSSGNGHKSRSHQSSVTRHESRVSSPSSATSSSSIGSGQPCTPCSESGSETSSSVPSDDEFDDVSATLLAQILDSLLEDDSTISAVLGDWTIISTYIKTYGELPEVGCRKLHETCLTKDCGQIFVSVTGLLPRDELQLLARSALTSTSVTCEAPPSPDFDVKQSSSKTTSGLSKKADLAERGQQLDRASTARLTCVNSCASTTLTTSITHPRTPSRSTLGYNLTYQFPPARPADNGASCSPSGSPNLFAQDLDRSRPHFLFQQPQFAPPPTNAFRQFQPQQQWNDVSNAELPDEQLHLQDRRSHSSCSPNGSRDLFAQDSDRRTSQFSLQFAPEPTNKFQQFQQQWNDVSKAELPDEQLQLQDRRSLSSAPSSLGLSNHLAGYNTTPSPPPHSSGPGQQQKTFAFTALPGNQVRKRPRRLYDEIVRLYPCNWPNCNKSYGTLNHLNAHVTMQRHGKKRSPNEFKEMRKQWRKQKKEAAALDAMRQAHHDAEYGTMHTHGMPSTRDPDSPSSLGLPSPSECSPIESGNSILGVLALPRPMSLPNLGLNGLGLDVSPPPLLHQPLHGFMNLPSLKLAPIPPQDFWMQQHAPQSAPPHQLAFLHEPLHLPQLRLPHESTLLTPLQRSDD